MTAIAPYGKYIGFDTNGNLLAGGKLYTYDAGTTTPKATYTTALGDVANANPVILNSSGLADVWLGDGGYKFVLKTSADVTIFTVDDIGGSSSTAFGSQVNAISTNTNITSVYANSVNICTGSPTLSLLAVGAAEEGFYLSVKNQGVGVVTIDPDAGELIDGQATRTIAAGESALIICDGTQWYTLFFYTGFAKLSSPNTFSAANTFNATVTMGAAVNETRATAIASATTTDIGAVAGNFVHITGTTTITGLGTIQAGTERTVTFDGILTLTHNATSLILPSGANITTAAGDSAIFRSEGSGNWRCISYNKASGRAIVETTITSWVAYTPTFTGFGTPTNITVFSRRVGSNLEVRGKFLPGTTTATEARITMGFGGTNNNVTSDSSVLGTTTNNVGLTAIAGLGVGTIYTLIEPSIGYMTFGFQDASNSGLSKANATIFSSGVAVSFFASIPISGW